MEKKGPGSTLKLHAPRASAVHSISTHGRRQILYRLKSAIHKYYGRRNHTCYIY